MLVLGSGPTGCVAAGFLARAGHRVTLLDRTRDAPAGRLVLDRASWDLLGDLGWQPGLAACAAERRSAAIRLVGRADAALVEEGVALVLLDRAAAVVELRRAAVDLGVRWMVGYTATVPIWEGRRVAGVRVRDAAGHERAFESRVVIDATGPRSFLAAALGQLVPRRGPRRCRVVASSEAAGGRDPETGAETTVVVMSRGHWLHGYDHDIAGVGGVLVLEHDSDSEAVLRGLPEFALEALGGPLGGVHPVVDGVGQHLLAQAGEGWVAVGAAAGCGGPGLPGIAATGVVGASIAAWEAELALRAGRAPAADQFGATINHARRSIALGSLLERALMRAAENGLLGWASGSAFRRRLLGSMLAGHWGPDVGRVGRSWYLWRLDRVTRRAARRAGAVRVVR